MLIQGSAVIPLNAQTDDVLVNNVLAIAQQRQAVQCLLTASATGVVVDVKVGTRDVCPQIAPNLQNRIPLYPDDFVDTFAMLPGDRLLLRARNTTGANITLFFAFRITPL